MTSRRQSKDFVAEKWMPAKGGVLRVVPSLFEERQARLRELIRSVESGEAPPPTVVRKLPPELSMRVWTKEEERAGRRAVDAYARGDGPPPTDEQVAACRSGRRLAKARSQR